MKKHLILLLILLLLLSLWACAAAESPAPEEKTGRSLTLMASQDWVQDIDLALFRKFEEESGIEVKVLLTPDNTYETLLRTTLAGGSSDIDIFMFPAGVKMVSFGIPKAALDLSHEPWADRLLPWARTANTADGCLLGFSTWGADWEGVLYNKTLFEEKGWTVPCTWEDFKALCEEIQSCGLCPMYESINSVHRPDAWLCALTYSILSERPDSIEAFNSDYLQFTDLQSVHRGLDQIREFFTHCPQWFMTDGNSNDWQGSYDALQNREAAMMLTYSAFGDELKARGSTDSWGMFPLPLLDSTVAVTNGYGISKFVSRHSIHKDESLALLDFLARDENLELYYAARPDLINPSFCDIAHTSYEMEAAADLMQHCTDICPVRLKSSILYWDTQVYLYIQGFAHGTMTTEEFISRMDAHREAAFSESLPHTKAPPLPDHR